MIEFVPAIRLASAQEPWIYEQRIVERCNVSQGDCWRWQGPLAPNGYGQINAWKKRWLVHRLAYTVMVGEIP